MSPTGILAYGSLIADPGTEIAPLIVRRIETRTPFGVEFGRYSRSRGGAPTVVPHSLGEPVRAEILVLREGTTVEQARDRLWRRERRSTNLSEAYEEKSGSGAVLVKCCGSLAGVAHVLYTDFNPEGKIERPDPQSPAEAAIASVAKAKPGMDVISYLIGIIRAEIETPLTGLYLADILRRTGAGSLEGALAALRMSRAAPGSPQGGST